MISKAKNQNFLRCFVALLLFAGSIPSGFSQQDNTIHLLPVIPQAAYSNPAFKPKAKFYLGFPALSSLYVGVAHTGFAYRDLIKRRQWDSLGIHYDSLYLHMDDVMEKLAQTNFVSVNVNEELFAFGFKARKNYISFSITEKASFRFGYPKDLIGLLWKGNGQFVGNTLDLSGIGVNFSLYNEIALGYMRDVRIGTQNFTFGTRLKYLIGMANVWTQRNNATVDINEDDFAHTANTDFLINIAGPDEMVSSLDSNSNDSTSNNSNFDPKEFLLHNTNKGFGIDLGVSYKLNKDFLFGVSVLDLGYINWKTGSGSSVRNYTSNVQDFTFDGIDINHFFDQSDSVINQQFSDIGDSLLGIFDVASTKNSYKAPLPTKIYLTAVYTITRHDKVGLLMRGEFFNKHMYPSFTVSYNKWFFNMLSAAVSYSIMNRSYLNLGFAMALNLGSWQTYVATDNLYCLFDPEGTRTVNFHFGMNFIFGYKDKRIKRSTPLLNNTPKESKK